MIQLRPHQVEAIKDIYSAWDKVKNILMVMPTGLGKCWAKNTHFLMYDGTIKMVQDVLVGDKLMGPDSKPRNVLSLVRGREEMFRITPVKGEPWECNKNHILSLKHTETDNITNISVEDYINTSKWFKHCNKQYRVGVEFKEQHLTYDPYFIGLYLAEGTWNQPQITNPDTEISSYCKSFARKNNLQIRNDKSGGGCDMFCFSANYRRNKNVVRDIMKLCTAQNSRWIPQEYKINSRENRLQLLAGLLDGDGFLVDNVFEITTKHKKLNDDILFLARSLGFAAYSSYEKKSIKSRNFEGYYYRITISGDTNLIPTKIKRKQATPRKQKKSVLKTGFKIESIGEGDYYGFMLDGDHRCIMGDFTVTHNSITLGSIINDKSFLSNTIHSTIIVHRKELVQQLSLMLCQFNIQHNVIVSTSDARRIVGEHLAQHKKSFYNPKARVTVASVDTLKSKPQKFQRIFDLTQLLVIDEAHHVLKENKWGQVVAFFQNPNLKILGVTATPQRLDRKGLGSDNDGIFDEMVTTETVQWGIDNKYLSKYKLVLPQNTPILAMKDKSDYTAKELNEYVEKNAVVGKTVENYIKFANGLQTIVFAATLTHGEQLLAEFKAHGIKAVFLHGETNPIERFKGVKDFANNTIQVIINVDLFDEGFDVPAVKGRRIVECVISSRPTMSLSKARQQWGRGLRPSDMKEHAIIIDQAGNVNRHGLPTKEIKWTLDRITKRKAKELLSTKNCYSCGAVNQRFAVKCEWCDTELVKPEGEGKPRSLNLVDGDLVLVDPDELDKLYKSTKLDSPQFMFDKVNRAAGYAAAMSAFKNQEKKIETQQVLADTIAKLYGYYKLDVKEDRELHKKLYADFNVSMFDMLTSSNKEMLNYINNISEFIVENYSI